MALREARNIYEEGVMASYDIQSHAQPHVKTPESVHGIRRQLGARFVLKDPKARNYVMSGLHPLRVTLVAHVKRLWVGVDNFAQETKDFI